MNLREIDRLAAEKVMGWKLRKCYEDECYITDEWVTDIQSKFNNSVVTIDVDKFNPSTNIQDAWLVLQKADDFVVNKATERSLGVRSGLAEIGDIHFGKLTEVEMQMIIDEMRRMLPYQIRMFQEESKLLKARYDALVAEGFSEKEALEIVKAKGSQL